MKIIFICGSLEPGKDGVGDYTRRLCGELIKQGVAVGMLAYNDKHISNKIQGQQNIEGIEIPSLRLPHTWTSKTRCFEAKNWLDTNNPAWISLQFVPYAFNNKGIPFGLASQLKKVGGDRNWHIMVHELWIAMDNKSSNKEMFIGYIQKAIIKRLFLSLKPNIVNTQTQLYIIQLEKLGIEASLLPLFSNIPVNWDLCKVENIDIPEDYFVLFGSIHYGAPIESFVKELISYKKTYKPSTLVTVGRNGYELNHWLNVWKSSGLEIICLGEQSSKVISYVLKNATFGISTTPMALVEKSGSVAAMHQHQLPVICISRYWKPSGTENNWEKQGITEYKFNNIGACLDRKKDFDPQKNNISKIIKSFLENLKIR